MTLTLENILDFTSASLDDTMRIIIDRGWNFELHSNTIREMYTAKVTGEGKESFYSMSSCPKETLQKCAINLELNLGSNEKSP